MSDEAALIKAIHEMAQSMNRVADNLAGIVNQVLGNMLTKADLLEHEKRENETLSSLFKDIKAIKEHDIRADQTARIVRYALTYGGIIAAGFSLAVLAVIQFADK